MANEEDKVIDTRFGSTGGLTTAQELDDHHRKMQGQNAPRDKQALPDDKTEDDEQ